MTVFALPQQPVFPPVELADEDGLLALGGDLSPPRVLLAYSMGIFPWFNAGDPPLWWAPFPRPVITPDSFRLGRSLKKALKKSSFEVRMDTAFEEVLNACATVGGRKEEGTWISDEMRACYLALHEAGYAHSIESWSEGRLVGGLYGLALGRCFFGESMFFLEANASKMALVALMAELGQRGLVMVDCQMSSPHTDALGAIAVDREQYMRLLETGGVMPSVSPDPGPLFLSS